MEALHIGRPQTLRSGGKPLIEMAERVVLKLAKDSWVVDLVAAESAFLRDLEDGQLVLLQGSTTEHAAKRSRV